MTKPRQLTKQEYVDALDRWVHSEYREHASELQSSKKETTESLQFPLSEAERHELERWLHEHNILE